MHYAISTTWGPTDPTEVFADARAEIVVCRPCAEARGIGADALVAGARFGGMDRFHAQAGRDDCKVVAF